MTGADRYELQQRYHDSRYHDDGEWTEWLDLPGGGFSIRFDSFNAWVGGLPYGRFYDHRVRAVNAQGHSQWSDPRTTYLWPAINAGHQEDHTVKYEMGSVPTTWTHDPPGEGTPSSTLSSAIGQGAAAWVLAISGHDGLRDAGLRLCINCPAGANHDGHTVKIRFATLKTNERGPHDQNPEHGCGEATACVKGQSADRHIESSTIVFEEPAFYLDKDRIEVAAYWTLDPDKQDEDVYDDEMNVVGKYRYIVATMVHELGHVLGLPEFYKHPSLSWYRPCITCDPEEVDAIMRDSLNYHSPQTADLTQLWKIYRGHSKHPHD